MIVHGFVVACRGLAADGIKGPVDLIPGEIRREGGNRAPLGHADFSCPLDHLFDQVPHLGVLPPFGDLLPPDVMADRLEGAGPIPVNPCRPPAPETAPHAGQGLMRGALGAKSVRVGTAVGLNDRFPDPCQRAWYHPIPNTGNLPGSHFPVRLRNVPLTMGLGLIGSGQELCANAV